MITRDDNSQVSMLVAILVFVMKYIIGIISQMLISVSECIITTLFKCGVNVYSVDFIITLIVNFLSSMAK